MTPFRTVFSALAVGLACLLAALGGLKDDIVGR